MVDALVDPVDVVDSLVDPVDPPLVAVDGVGLHILSSYFTD